MSCTKIFPITLLAIQMTVLVGAILLGPALFTIAKPPQGTPGLSRFLSHGTLRAEIHNSPVEAESQPADVPTAEPPLPAAPDDTAGLLVEVPVPAAVLPSAYPNKARPYSYGASSPARPAANPSAARLDSFSSAGAIAGSNTGDIKSASVASALPASNAGSGMAGWIEVGEGFCEESGSHQELSSLHASGKSLQQCVEDAKRDPQSIAVDFSDSGECDIRYPAGALAIHIDGYGWWGWGGGTGNPVGSGKAKHDSKTICLARVMPSTTKPPPATLPPTHVPSASEQHELVQRGKGRFSIVPPCASEGMFMVNTVRSFCERTPEDLLQEIIVVDDGTEPPLESMLTGIEPRCRLRYLRHKEILGLMIAKQTGGDAATGEFIGFFDCHVCPNKIWHTELIQVLKGGPRRMAVPTITDLDIDTWDERENSQINSKCYIDFNAQFMWFEDESDYIPVISGGLVALTRDWWIESGGFDNSMRGWGGENVDQSLRTWLCGGEIVRAKSSRIAHMWRVPSDSRTSAHYKHVSYGVDNIARVAAAWFDKFSSKYRDGMLEGPNGPPDV